MRLTFVINSLSSGGAERVMSNMANHWAFNGWDITLITLDSSSTDFYPLNPKINREVLGVLKNTNSIFSAISNNIKSMRKIRRSIKDSSPDVVVSFMVRTNVLTLISTRGLGLNVIVSDRNDPSKNRSIIWGLLRRWFYRYASAVVSQTKAAYEWTDHIVYSGKIHIIPNAIFSINEDIDHETKLSSKNYFHNNYCTIIAIGRLNEEKGFDLLMKAFAKVAPLYPFWRLLILGEGEQKDSLKFLANNLQISNQIIFAGRKKNPLFFLKKSDIFVLSSRSEGFPNVLLEAMACGLPVISFDCPNGPNEIINHEIDGILVPQEDWNALSDALKELMDDQSKRKLLSSNARKSCQRYSSKVFFCRWEALINKVVND